MARPTAQQAASPTGPWQLGAARARQAALGLHWPAPQREAALARLDQSGLPDTSQEDWRNTSLSGYLQRWIAYQANPGRPAKPADEDTRRVLPPAGVTLEILDGVLQGRPEPIPHGLTVCSLRAVTAESRAVANALLDRAAALAPESLVDLNSALLTDVVLIATATGVDVTLPVHVHIRGGSTPAFAQPRLLVNIAAGSHLTLVVEHRGAAGTLANSVTQAWIGTGGSLRLVRVQSLPDDGMLTESTRIELAEAATLGMTSVDLGGQLSRQSVSVVLAGRNASASIDGLFLADGLRHIDNQTRLEHQATGTTSRESFRGIADGHGHGVFNGKIIVQPGAAGSNAALTNRNLLLSATAEIDTKPELEIYVDDVRCSHGATTGQLDPNALFYLRSRGLDPASARQVLTAAFLREGLGTIGLPDLRARLDAQLQGRLGGADAIAGPGAAR